MHSFFAAQRSVLVCLSIIAAAVDPALSATIDKQRIFQKIDDLRRIPVLTRANIEKTLGIRTWREAAWYWSAKKSEEFKAVTIVIDRQGNVCAVDLEFPDEIDIRVTEIERRYGRRSATYPRRLHPKATAGYVYGTRPKMTFSVSETVRPPRALLVTLTAGPSDAKFSHSRYPLAELFRNAGIR